MAEDQRTSGRDLAARIERALEREAGVNAVVEIERGVVRLNGMVTSAEERQAAEDIVSVIAPEMRIDDALEVESTVPASIDDVYAGEPSSGLFLDSVRDDLRGQDKEISPDFTDQSILEDPMAAVGSGPDRYDPVAEGDDVYTPPSDPVVTTGRRGDVEVLNGFSEDSMESINVDRSAEDNRPGDEAIEDAIRRELREDSMTTDLRLNVFVRGGVAHIRGRVPGAEDAEAAEDVASRVPGVVEVVDETRVEQV